MSFPAISYKQFQTIASKCSQVHQNVLKFGFPQINTLLTVQYIISQNISDKSPFYRNMIATITMYKIKFNSGCRKTKVTSH